MTTFRDLGLSSYEEKAYTALIDLGSGTAEAVAGESGVPMGRIYDILNGLTSRDLVRRRPGDRPRTYVPVAPERAVERLLAARKRELEVEQARYETVAAEIRAEFGRAEPMDGRFWTAELGQEGIAELLADRLDAATEEVLITATTAAGGLFGFEAVYSWSIDRIADALDRGVTVKLLFTEGLVAALPDEMTAGIDRAFLDRSGFELRTTDEVYNTFDVIDRRDICVYVADPFDPDAILGTIALTDPDFVARIVEGTTPHWEAASVVTDLA